jgi:phage shock protein C
MSPRKPEKTETVTRLFKSRKDRIIDGVCGGVAEYINVKPAAVRIAWLILLFFHGLGFILYVAGMILMPVNPEHKALKSVEKPKHHPELFVGMFLVFIGLLLVSNWVNDSWGWHHPFGFWGVGFWPFPWRFVLPILLILIGVVYMLGVIQRHPGNGEDSVKSEKSGTKGKVLYRSRNEKMIGGVCGGLASYFGIDPTLARLLYVVFTIATSFVFGILVYIALLIFVPKKED